MCNKSKASSLFDRLLQELDYDLSKTGYYRPSETPTGAETRRIDRASPVQPGDLAIENYNRALNAPDAFLGRRFAIDHLVQGLRKRYIGPTKGDSRSAADRKISAVTEILGDNGRCKVHNKTFKLSTCNGFIKYIVSGSRRLLFHSLMDNGQCNSEGVPYFTDGIVLTISNIASSLCFGPGASSGAGGDSGTYGRACDGDLSYTSLLVRNLYRTCTRSTQLGALTESLRQNLPDIDDSFAYCKFSSVPKTNSKDRGICTQPSANMALQLAIHRLLVIVLKGLGVDLENQQFLNRDLAMKGSRGTWHGEKRTWRFVTLDLTSASNFPLVTARLLLPSWVYKIVMLIRSPFLIIKPTKGHNDEIIKVRKHMLSTMGNGFTFSLMTLLLVSIVKTIVRAGNLPEYDTDPLTGKSVKCWAVYGDDIIVDVSVVNGLIQVLTALGFSVNTKKSCIYGLFRESCGADFYDGYPVRPVFLESLVTVGDVYSLINRLNSWSAMHSVDLMHTIALLRSCIVKPLIVPNWEDVSSGLHAPYALAVHNPMGAPKALKGLGGTAYECLEATTIKRTLFKESVRRVYYTKLPDTYFTNIKLIRDIKTLEKIIPSLELPDLSYLDPVKISRTQSYLLCSRVEWSARNVPGVLFSMLDGSVRVGKYGVRLLGGTQYKKVWRYAPSWGDATLNRRTDKGLRSSTTCPEHTHWEMQVQRNLTSNQERVSTVLSSLKRAVGLTCATTYFVK